PFGLSVAFNNPNWAGAFYGESSTLKTYNVAPNVAYKLADWISVGVGFQAQYATVNLKNATGIPIAGFSSPNVNLAQLTGYGWVFGWTAGVTVTPTPWTQIGLGYRSAVNQSINGDFETIGFGGTPGPVSTTIKLPDSASLGIRQGLMPGLTALGTVEWTGWKRIGTSIISQPSGQAALAPSRAPVTVPFQWNDGWFYSVGLEYVASPAWIVRGGVGYEISPVTDQVRIPLLPDNNRIWYSVGLTNNVTPGVSVDLAYSFVDVQNATINVVPGNPSFNGLVTYTGTSKASISIFSVGVKFKLGEPPAVATRGIACPGREALSTRIKLPAQIRAVENRPRKSLSGARLQPDRLGYGVGRRVRAGAEPARPRTVRAPACPGGCSSRAGGRAACGPGRRRLPSSMIHQGKGRRSLLACRCIRPGLGGCAGARTCPADRAFRK